MQRLSSGGTCIDKTITRLSLSLLGQQSLLGQPDTVDEQRYV